MLVQGIEILYLLFTVALKRDFTLLKVLQTYVNEVEKILCVFQKEKYRVMK